MDASPTHFACLFHFMMIGMVEKVKSFLLIKAGQKNLPPGYTLKRGAKGIDRSTPVIGPLLWGV